MLIPNHPDDERLSALASRDTDATADAGLMEHVASCARCTELVDELGSLRMALAELPDLAPSRPLRLVPAAEDDRSPDRLGGWARRFFAPLLASGAALALVGVIGTAAPSLGGFGAASGVAPIAQEEAAEAPAASTPGDMAEGSAAGLEPATAEGGAGESRDSSTLSASHDAAGDGSLGVASAPASVGAGGQDEAARTTLETERSPWPMVLFAGVALMVGAGLMRWILAPRPA